MKRSRAKLKMKITIITLTLLIFSCGCATSKLHGTIQEKEEVAREWQETTLRGRFSGEVIVNDKTFLSYEFCGFKDKPERILMLLKPKIDGKVILLEHENYQLEGDLPIIMETGFGVETNFKTRFYRRVNFAGEDIKIEQEDLQQAPPGFNAPPRIQLELAQGPEPRINPPNQNLNLRRFKKADFIRPKDSGNKWYLMTTRVQDALMNSQTATHYFLSTPEKRYKINTDALDYDERNWLGNKLLRTGHLVSVPLDIISIPFIYIGVGATILFKEITN